MFPSFTIQEGWESPFTLELEPELCSHEECLNIFRIIKNGCASDCDIDILCVIDNVIARIHEINYGIKRLIIDDPFIRLVHSVFNYLNVRKGETLFNERRVYIYEIYNNYLKNEPLDSSPHPVSPTSPPIVETKGKIQNLKETMKVVPVPKIMKKAKKN